MRWTLLSVEMVPHGVLVLIACLAGLVLGWERAACHKSAGVRTHVLVALGVVLFTIAGREIGGDPARVAAQVVTGIGFLGGGVIFRTGQGVKGLTTAASIWVTAAIALMLGTGTRPMVELAVASTFASVLILAVVPRIWLPTETFRLNVTGREGVELDELLRLVRRTLQELTRDDRTYQPAGFDRGRPAILRFNCSGDETAYLAALARLPEVAAVTIE